MVGDPKNLSDLRKIEAQVQVTCKSCKASETWELDAVIAEVRANGGNTDWRSARYALKCPKRCSAPMITIAPVPYGKRRARGRAARHIMINLALQILREAAWRSAKEPIGTIEVRLALHALRPFVRDASLLVKFWEAGTEMPRHPWTTCHNQYRWIVDRVITEGFEVDEANRP